MKNTMKKVLSLALAAAMCFSLCGFIGTASAAEYAASTQTPVQISINPGIKINITTYDADGKETTGEYKAVDVNGTEVMPFICDGTTYLPLRAISYIFGGTANDISWDSFLHNAYLSTPKTALKVVNPNPGTATIPTGAKTVSAVSGSTLYVNGSTDAFVPTDANGKVVAIYNIDGTIYFPVRAISNIYFGDEATANEHLSYTNGVVTITGTKVSASGDTSLLDQLPIADIITEMVAKVKNNLVTFMIDPIYGFKTMKSMLSSLASGGESSDQSIITSMIQLMNPAKVLELFKKVVGTMTGDSSLDISGLLAKAGGIGGIMKAVMAGVFSEYEAPEGSTMGGILESMTTSVGSVLGLLNPFNAIDRLF